MALTFDGTNDKIFVKKWAAYGSAALVGMVCWVRGMVDYHEAAKAVNPKIKRLESLLSELSAAETELKLAEAYVQNPNAFQIKAQT